ncbi:hypothetical protein [Nitratireductor pacificus]|uniref:Uncharacterized protein n=1 Tax=Nitratireductor pacificus pht-3B TaxID=391937 RepID=K2MYK3_9HYPH|nr:hypothetical protein [Nitratireductor pacificus]EKF17048.1 hypothetical protein NA2_19798 [Nitratireductor pacificus pht-3B]
MFGLSIGAWLRAGAAVAVLGALTWSHLAVYRAGRSAEQAAFAEKINQQNEEAGNAAEDWRARYRRCVDTGGLFDHETGTCDQ